MPTLTDHEVSHPDGHRAGPTELLSGPSVCGLNDYEECEALLEQYDAVIVSDTMMITYVDRIPKLTGGVIPDWMTDQLGAELRDLPVGQPQPADETGWRAT